MSEQPHLVWGIVGASDIAETRMIPALRRTGHHISSVYSGNSDHAEQYARRNEISNRTNKLNDLLSDPLIDAVYISSANDRHLEQVCAAAAAGKHVLCEKPLSTSIDNARKMIAACESAGVVLGVNHHLPAAGTHQAIRRTVTRGDIGRILSVSVRHTSLLPERLRGWRLGSAPGSGAVMDLSCHNASVVNPLLGTRALTASAITVAQGDWVTEAEDAASSSILYENNVLVRFHDTFTTPFAPTYVEVHGTAGSLHAADVMTPEPIGSVVLHDGRGSHEIDVEDRRHTYDITLEHFTRATRGDGRPVVDGLDATNALAVSISILESARTGSRVPVDFCGQ